MPSVKIQPTADFDAWMRDVQYWYLADPRVGTELPQADYQALYRAGRPGSRPTSSGRRPIRPNSQVAQGCRKVLKIA